MSILVMPVAPRKVGSNLVILLSIFDNLHIQIYHRHAFCTAAEACQGASIGDAYLGETSIALPCRTTCIGEYDRFI